MEGRGGRCVGLTTLPPSCADGPQPPGTFRASLDLYRDCFTLYIYINTISGYVYICVYIIFIYLSVQTSSGAHPDSYSINTEGFSQSARQSGYNWSKVHPSNAIKHAICRTSITLCI